MDTRATEQDEQDAERNHDDAEQTGKRDGTAPDGDGDDRAVVETRPSVRPTVLWLVGALVVGLGSIGLVVTNEDALGGPDAANVVANALLLLTVIAGLRLLVRIWVLRQTTYRVTGERIHRSYALLLRRRSRQVPMEMVRSYELRQSRVQSLLGYGTIHVNEGLGPIELENIPNPRSVADAIERHRE